MRLCVQLANLGRHQLKLCVSIYQLWLHHIHVGTHIDYSVTIAAREKGDGHLSQTVIIYYRHGYSTFLVGLSAANRFISVAVRSKGLSVWWEWSTRITLSSSALLRAMTRYDRIWPVRTALTPPDTPGNHLGYKGIFAAEFLNLHGISQLDELWGMWTETCEQRPVHDESGTDSCLMIMLSYVARKKCLPRTWTMIPTPDPVSAE